MKIGNCLIAALTILLLSSCFIDDMKVKSTASRFIKAYSSENFEEAQKMATKEGQENLDMLMEMVKLTKESGEEVESKDFSIQAVAVNGDSAKVTYTMEGEDELSTLDLKKVDGTWKVDFKKNL